MASLPDPTDTTLSTQDLDDDRKTREAAFHDHAYAEDVRAAATRFYSIVRKSENCYADRLALHGRGGRALEYGCGPGSYAWHLREHGATVTGIDISQEAIDQARDETQARGLDGIDFLRMDAEKLEFPDATFDLVCGSGILHHLDLERAYAEVHRVLKPDGVGVFYEPLGHNPAINWYRNRTPEMRTVDEHPLLVSDFDLAKRWFRRVAVRYFHMSSLMVVPWRGRPGFGSVVRALNRLDQAVFRGIPWLRRYAWYSVIVLEGRREVPLAEVTP